MTGRIRCAGAEFTMDGVAYRDHSRGPRSFGGMAGSVWVHGRFRNWSFAIFHVSAFRDGLREVASAKAVIWEGGRMHEAEAIDLPYVLEPGAASGEYTMRLSCALGTRVLKARIVRSITMSVTQDYDWYYGLTPAIGYLGVYEEPTVFECADETGAGWTERSVRFHPD
jgi:hypothetical protein